MVSGTRCGAESAAAGRRELPRYRSPPDGLQTAPARHRRSRVTSSVNQRYEEGLYFSDYLAFCLQASQYVT